LAHKTLVYVVGRGAKPALVGKPVREACDAPETGAPGKVALNHLALAPTGFQIAQACAGGGGPGVGIVNVSRGGFCNEGCGGVELA
jgi:hypothetical protein